LIHQGGCLEPLNHLLQVNPHQQLLPFLLDFIEELVKNDPNVAERHSGIINDNCLEVINDIEVRNVVLSLTEILEEVLHMVKGQRVDGQTEVGDSDRRGLQH
jgi:hypothetical protein